MAFTGKLGNSGSKLGNIKLGISGGASNNACGQAQCKINAFGVNRFGQTQSDIKSTGRGFGQANALIESVHKDAYGQALSLIANPYERPIFVDRFNRTFGPNQGLGPDYTWNIWDSRFATQADTTIFISPSAIHLPYNDYDSYNLNVAVPTRAAIQIDIYIPALVNQSPEHPEFGFQVPLNGNTSTEISAYITAIGDGTFRLSTSTNAEVFVSLDPDNWYTFKFTWDANAAQTITVWKTGTTEPSSASITETLTYSTSTDLGSTIFLDFFFAAEQTGALLTNLVLSNLPWWGSGQAAALIDSPIKQQWAQAQAYIYLIVYKFGQAQAFIRKSAGYGQANTDIKAERRGFANAQAKILRKPLNPAQAQAYIRLNVVYGQAQAAIKHGGSGQAQASINKYPRVTGTATTVDGTQDHNQTINLPSGIVSGNLLIAGISYFGGRPSSETWPSGWISLLSLVGDGIWCMSVRYKYADGSEGSSITLTTPENASDAAICYKIENADLLIPPEVSFNTLTQSSTQDPPSLTVSWGETYNLWIAMCGQGSSNNLSSFPSEFTDNRLSAGVGSINTVFGATREDQVATENPSAFTLSGNNRGVPLTIGIRSGNVGHWGWGQAQARIYISGYQSGQAQAFIGLHKYAQANALISVDPVIWYKLDDTASPLVDSKDSTNLTVTNTPTYNVGGYKQGSQAVTFGSSSYASNASPSASLPTGSSARSYEFWVKTTTTSRMVMLGHGSSNTRQAFNASLNHDSTNQIGYWSWSDDTFFTATGLTNGNWHHIVYTYASAATQIKIYYDGALLGTGTLGGSLNTTSSTTLYLANSIQFGELLTGTLDEVKIYNFALTASQVAEKYGSRISGYGQAQVFVGNRPITANGQALATIKGISSQYGQTQAFIIRSIAYGQTNALIDSPHKQAYGQALAILNTRFKFAQAQGTIFVPANAYETVIYAELPTNYWPLNDASGTVAVARTGPNGTYKASGITYQISAPMAANAYGVGITATPSTTMQTNASDVSNTFSFEVWYKTSGTTNIPGSETITGVYSGALDTSGTSGTPNNVWFPEQRGSSRGAGVSVGTNGIVVEAHGDSTLCAPSVYSATISSGWHHLVIVVDSKVPKTYLDGILVHTGLTILETYLRPRWLLGTDSYGPFRGSVDNAALYNFALDATQVQNHYNAGVPRGYGQALAQITNKMGFGQALCQVNYVVYVSGQAQAKLNAFNVNAFGQAQADILVTTTKSAQVNAVIKAQDGIVRIHLNSSGVNDGTYADQRGPQQPNYDSTNASLANEGYAFTAAFNADETGTWSFRVSVDDGADFWVDGTRIIDAGFLTRFAGEAIFDGTVSLTSGTTHTFVVRFYQGGGPFAFRSYYKRPSDSTWWFLTDNNPPWIRINANAGFGQAQTQVTRTFSSCGQAQAQIGHLQWAQSQADIKSTTNKSGQAQARLIAFDVPRCGQAQCIVASRFAVGQANSDIKAPNQAYGQALAFVGHFKWAQTQAQIKAFNVPASGQANADIVNTNRNFGLALAAIDHGGHGQANADIKKRTNSTGNAFAFILPPTFWGQAQARIIAFNVPRFGQANADIHNVYYPSGQAQAYIDKGTGTGLTLVDIKQHYRNVGQARVVIGHTQSGLAQAFISKSVSSGNAQADIKTNFVVSAQAQAQIYHKRGYATVQADIKATYPQSAQVLALLNTGFGLAQVMASIVQTYTPSGQAKARIKTTLRNIGQAQAWIRVRHTESGQAVAYIIGTYMRVGQARVFINHFKWGQAQCRIIGFNVPRTGQAQAYLIANPTSPPPTPSSDANTYLVSYNNQTLPGYAQSESYESTMRLNTARAPYAKKTTTDILGLSEKEIDMTMKVWESSYIDCKTQVEKAATILRSVRNNYAKLYIQHYDKYYMAKVQNLKTEKSVGSGARTLDYNVQFTAKPWLTDNSITTISGTGTISTDVVARTFTNGGWTPTKVRVSGTNITISGYTATEFAGYVSVSGSVTDLVIDTENFTAYDGSGNRNEIISPLDRAIYVGPGKTTYVISGATTCTIEWQNRWYL